MMWYLADVGSGKSSYQLRDTGRDTSDDPIIRAVDGASTVFNSKKRKEAFESIDTNGSTADRILSRVYAGTGVGATVVAGTASAAYLAQFAPALTGAIGTGTTKAYIASEVWLNSVIGKVATGYLFANPDVGFDLYTTWQDIVNRNFGALPMDGLAFAYNSLDYNLYKYTKNRNYNTSNIEQTETQKNFNKIYKQKQNSINNLEIDSSTPVVKTSKNKKAVVASVEAIDTAKVVEVSGGTKLTKTQLATKPKNSPDPIKWQKKGGKITIDENGTWTYHDWDSNSVTYPDGYPDYKSADMVKQEVDIGEFESYPKDFSKADELAPNGPMEDTSTWHHHQNGTTMQEIESSLHDRFRHRGGMSISKKSKKTKEVIK
jgi:hypothetical protein